MHVWARNLDNYWVSKSEGETDYQKTNKCKGKQPNTNLFHIAIILSSKKKAYIGVNRQPSMGWSRRAQTFYPIFLDSSGKD